MRSNPFGNGKDVLTTGEVAKICNVAARTVSKWIDAGRRRTVAEVAVERMAGNK